MIQAAVVHRRPSPGLVGVPAGKEPVEIVVGVLSGPHGVLLCRRSASSPRFPGRWDFPGGHAEPGESRLEALARELLEEIGVVVQVGSTTGTEAPGLGDFSVSTSAQDGTDTGEAGWRSPEKVPAEVVYDIDFAPHRGASEERHAIHPAGGPCSVEPRPAVRPRHPLHLVEPG